MQQKFTLLCAFFFLFITGKAQWKEVSEPAMRIIPGSRRVNPDQYRVFQLTEATLQQQLRQAPKEFSRNSTPAVLLIPMPDGTLQRFSVFDSPIMEPGLQQKFPEIRTYSGQGLDDPYASVRISWSPSAGFQARVLSPAGDVYVDPYASGNRQYVQSYYQRNLPQTEPFLEAPLRKVPEGQRSRKAFRTSGSAPCRGTQLFTYRAAISCTGEYAVAVTGKSAPTKAEVMAAIVNTMNRVNQVFERDLAIRMVLVANNDQIVYTDSETDPYEGNNSATKLVEESNSNIPLVVGNANFDIGHTFSTGAGGLAYLGVVCFNGYKAGGVTGRTNPTGDAYDIDYVAHEIGHQFGGNHTFRGTRGNCNGNGNFGADGTYTAYEPGSGSSIQGYAGICSSDNMQPNSDPYFHAISYDEIIAYVTTGDGFACRGIINTGNSIPVIAAMNGNGASIPVGTPFTLSATATDTNGDPLTYSWEQWDVGTTAMAYNSSTGYEDGDAIWRSRVPTTDGKRTIPDIRYVAANYPSNPPAQMNGLKGELLSTKTRSYSFKLTVRDNRAGGGGVATGGGKPVDSQNGAGGVGCSFTTPYVIHVVPGSFTLESQNGGETLMGGVPVTVNWTNTGTDLPPINCSAVRISLSTDGGLTYPITVLNNTGNDGSEQVIIPNIPSTTTARLRVEAADNIFFDISNANFTIVNNATLPVGLKEFTVKPQGSGKAVLHWNTVMEQENSGFEVQRSIGNDASFVTIALKAGTNSLSGNDYAYTDENLPVNKTIYYRLKQVDRSGQSRVSETRMIRFNERGIYLNVQPNPAKDFVTVTNSGSRIAGVLLQVFDATGRVVKSAVITLEQSTSINLFSLAKGFYTVRISAGNEELLTTKLLKE